MFQLNFVILSKVQGLIQYPSLLGYNNIFRATIQCNLITIHCYISLFLQFHCKDLWIKVIVTLNTKA